MRVNSYTTQELEQKAEKLEDLGKRILGPLNHFIERAEELEKIAEELEIYDNTKHISSRAVTAKQKLIISIEITKSLKENNP